MYAATRIQYDNTKSRDQICLAMKIRYSYEVFAAKAHLPFYYILSSVDDQWMRIWRV